MMKPTKVFKICNAYESGFGHGYNNDDKDCDYYSDPDLNEAYKIGYQEGMARCVSDAEGVCCCCMDEEDTCDVCEASRKGE